MSGLTKKDKKDLEEILDKKLNKTLISAFDKFTSAIVEMFNTTNKIIKFTVAKSEVNVEKKLGDRIEKVEIRLHKVDNRLAKVEEVVTNMDKRLVGVVAKLDDTNDHLKDHHKLSTLQDKRIGKLEQKVFITTS